MSSLTELNIVITSHFCSEKTTVNQKLLIAKDIASKIRTYADVSPSDFTPLYTALVRLFNDQHHEVTSLSLYVIRLLTSILPSPVLIPVISRFLDTSYHLYRNLSIAILSNFNDSNLLHLILPLLHHRDYSTAKTAIIHLHHFVSQDNIEIVLADLLPLFASHLNIVVIHVLQKLICSYPFVSGKVLQHLLYETQSMQFSAIFKIFMKLVRLCVFYCHLNASEFKLRSSNSTPIRFNVIVLSELLAFCHWNSADKLCPTQSESLTMIQSLASSISINFNHDLQSVSTNPSAKLHEIDLYTVKCLIYLSLYVNSTFPPSQKPWYLTDLIRISLEIANIHTCCAWSCARELCLSRQVLLLPSILLAHKRIDLTASQAIITSFKSRLAIIDEETFCGECVKVFSGTFERIIRLEKFIIDIRFMNSWFKRLLGQGRLAQTDLSKISRILVKHQYYNTSQFSFENLSVHAKISLIIEISKKLGQVGHFELIKTLANQSREVANHLQSNQRLSVDPHYAIIFDCLSYIIASFDVNQSLSARVSLLDRALLCTVSFLKHYGAECTQKFFFIQEFTSILKEFLIILGNYQVVLVVNSLLNNQISRLIDRLSSLRHARHSTSSQTSNSLMIFENTLVEFQKSTQSTTHPVDIAAIISNFFRTIVPIPSGFFSIVECLSITVQSSTSREMSITVGGLLKDRRPFLRLHLVFDGKTKFTSKYLKSNDKGVATVQCQIPFMFYSSDTDTRSGSRQLVSVQAKLIDSNQQKWGSMITFSV
ncbi:hypothetical protein GEMRC1_003396 [Eukaryota sp. GEM-RC1]